MVPRRQSSSLAPAPHSRTDLHRLGLAALRPTTAGYDGPPFRWDEARRFLLRCELDAAFFHLYGLNRDDAAHILDTFPVVRKRDEARYGEYRTKRVILDVYDQLAKAIESGAPHRTLLDPPPGDSSRRHPAAAGSFLSNIIPSLDKKGVSNV